MCSKIMAGNKTMLIIPDLTLYRKHHGLPSRKAEDEGEWSEHLVDINDEVIYVGEYSLEQ